MTDEFKTVLAVLGISETEFRALSTRQRAKLVKLARKGISEAKRGIQLKLATQKKC